jgi:hypothetical protein
LYDVYSWVLELTAASTDAPAPEAMDFAAPIADPPAPFAVVCIVDGAILKDKPLENKEKKLPRPLLNLLLVVVLAGAPVAPTV